MRRTRAYPPPDKPSFSTRGRFGPPANAVAASRAGPPTRLPRPPPAGLAAACFAVARLAAACFAVAWFALARFALLIMDKVVRWECFQ